MDAAKKVQTRHALQVLLAQQLRAQRNQLLHWGLQTWSAAVLEAALGGAESAIPQLRQQLWEAREVIMPCD